MREIEPDAVNIAERLMVRDTEDDTVREVVEVAGAVREYVADRVGLRLSDPLKEWVHVFVALGVAMEDSDGVKLRVAVFDGDREGVWLADSEGEAEQLDVALGVHVLE